MKVRKFNFLLLVLTLLGGVMGAITGEMLMARFMTDIPTSILVGLYFGQLGLWIGGMAFIAEKWKPVLTGKRWADQYALFSLKLLLPVMFILPFAAGTILQYVYELDASTIKRPQDIVLVLDVSGSMLETDPDEKTVTAVKEFLMNMNKSQRSSLFLFNDETSMIQPFTSFANDKERENAGKAFEEVIKFSGGTDIARSLAESIKYIDSDNSGRRTMVVLLSDGISEVNVGETLQPFQNREIVINTVGLSREKYEGAKLLSKISAQTGGQYYSVNDTDKLADTFQEIQKNAGERLLIGERTGSAGYMLLYKIMRIAFIALIGAVLGMALGLMFDNRFLAQSFTWGGLAAGLIAGFVMEWGFRNYYLHGFLIRVSADILLAVIISIFSAIVPYRMYMAREGKKNGILSSRMNAHKDLNQKKSSNSFH